MEMSGFRWYNNLIHITMREFTITLPETKAYYEEELNNYKTVSSKKAFLTRSRKDVEEWHDDLVGAYNRPQRMLHGERVGMIDIHMTVGELRILRDLYKQQ